MPMFHTPKPRQFRYQPRFYDPEQEQWEARKAMYRLRQGTDLESITSSSSSKSSISSSTAPDADLAYYEARLRQLDARHQRQSLGWRDLFRKREKPTFHYQPRFGAGAASSSGTASSPDAAAAPDMAAAPQPDDGLTHAAQFKRRGINIHRRFDMADTDYMKPIPAGRIMLYALLACMLLYWILF